MYFFELWNLTSLIPPPPIMEFSMIFFIFLNEGFPYLLDISNLPQKYWHHYCLNCGLTWDNDGTIRS